MKSVAELMAFLFGPGTLLRSDVYLEAFEAILTANRDSLLRRPLCPFKPGTLEHDAWFCGVCDAERFDEVNFGVIFDEPDDLDGCLEVISAG